ncbi:MAG: AbrB/MazE/SpoVT family DNA-binding domain-containing protein [Nitrososphaerota archaeon]|nr:AbrB/MazE/SpoVT family DNA-binding domain-containing protein [Nitrososphaerota archaeon]
MSKAIVTVTKKGQATIPKKMRVRHKIGKKALVVDTEQGFLVRAILDPSLKKGSLRSLFKTKTSKEIMNEIRREEFKREPKSSMQRT